LSLQVPASDAAPARDGPRITVVLSEIGGHLFGINMAHVTAIEDLVTRHPGEEGSEPWLDIADLWGVPGPAQPRARRRVLTIETQAGRCRLVVGHRATVKPLAMQALQPLPAFLEEVGRRSAVAALFIDESRVGLLLEVDGIEARQTGGGGQ
jgi:hypothetical protein